MATKERHIYGGGNTARGYQMFFDSILSQTKKVYLLTGVVEGITTSVIERIGTEMGKKTDQVEWIHSPFVVGHYDGVLFPEWNVAIMDNSYPRIWRPQGPAVTEVHMNLQTVLIPERLTPYQEHIATWFKGIARKSQEAYDSFAEALRIHDEWEAIYIDNFDREEADRTAEEVKQLFLGEESLPKKSIVRRMYLGAATPQGPVDHVMNLTDSLEKRYFIKGRPGSGKSTMLKKLVIEAENRGFDAEVYHCGLDPHSLDMVILPEKSVAIFDSTAPHEYFPSKPTDEVIDMYTRAITPGTDEKYSEQLMDIKARYALKIKAATACLAEAKEMRDQLNRVYTEASDEVRLNAVSQDIISVLEQIS